MARKLTGAHPDPSGADRDGRPQFDGGRREAPVCDWEWTSDDGGCPMPCRDGWAGPVGLLRGGASVRTVCVSHVSGLGRIRALGDELRPAHGGAAVIAIRPGITGVSVIPDLVRPTAAGEGRRRDPGHPR